MPDDLQQTYSQLLRAFRQLRPDEHLCPIYESREEQLVEALAFVQIGLERGERCLYIVDAPTASAALELARRLGVDLEQAHRSGALVITEGEESQPLIEHFDPELRFHFLTEAVRQARDAGFQGFRWIGEMVWHLGRTPDKQRLIEYEARLDGFVHQHQASALCQYDRHSFAPDVILNAMRTHPVLIRRGRVCQNPYYIPPKDLSPPCPAEREVERHLGYILDREQAAVQLDFQATLLEHISDAVLAFDEHTLLTAWNRAAEQHYGWSAEEVLGRPLHGVLRPQFIGMTDEEAAQALQRDGHLEAEAIVQRRDGGIYSRGDQNHAIG